LQNFHFFWGGPIIENVRLLDAEVVGKGGVGCLAGVNEKEIYTSSCVGEIAGENNIGGLLGASREAYEENCYARGSVKASTDHAGGFIGFKFKGDTVGSYSAVSVGSASSKGGLISFSTGTIKSCFYNKDLVGSPSSLYGTGFSTDEMKYDYDGINVPVESSGPYYDWNFDGTWEHDKTGEINDYYPFLVYSK
jgi:hypothetical protein